MLAVALLLPLCCAWWVLDKPRHRTLCAAGTGQTQTQYIVWQVLDKPRHSTLCAAGTGQTQTQHIVSGRYWTNPDTAYCIWQVLDKPRHSTLSGRYWTNPDTAHYVWRVLDKPRDSTLCLAGTGQTQTTRILVSFWRKSHLAETV